MIYHSYLAAICTFYLILQSFASQEIGRCVSVNGGSCTEKEEAAFKSLSQLHAQLDDDKDGGVDAVEADGFVRDELQYTDNFERARAFNSVDKSITKEELWSSWRRSEVYNWTVDDVIDWLQVHVELPEYSKVFHVNVVDGSRLPLLASNNHEYIKSILKIKNPVHKHKIVLKAMDVVLFGPPKKVHNYAKDVTLVVSLLVALAGFLFAVLQQSHKKKMTKELEELSRSEKSLVDLQKRLKDAEQRSADVHQEKKEIEIKMRDEVQQAKIEASRLAEERKHTEAEQERLAMAEEEVAYLRTMLEESERRSLSAGWSAPIDLQPWLQLCYEMELQYYNTKKSAAEMQLEQAREGCEKLRKKRGAFMGSLRIAHSSNLDDVDKRITEAREALEEVRQDLQERLHRWSQIELLTNLQIITNPGLSQLKSTLAGSAASTPASAAPPNTFHRSESSNNMQSHFMAAATNGPTKFVRHMVRSESFVRPYANLWRQKALEQQHGLAVVNKMRRSCSSSAAGMMAASLQNSTSTDSLNSDDN